MLKQVYTTVAQWYGRHHVYTTRKYHYVVKYRKELTYCCRRCTRDVYEFRAWRIDKRTKSIESTKRITRYKAKRSQPPDKRVVLAETFSPEWIAGADYVPTLATCFGKDVASYIQSFANVKPWSHRREWYQMSIVEWHNLQD